MINFIQDIITRFGGRYFGSEQEKKAQYYTEEVLKKYRLFVDVFVYGKYVNDELSVACYWTNRGNEGFKLLNEIIDDSDQHFIEHKDRFEMNKKHFTNKYSILHL